MSRRSFEFCSLVTKTPLQMSVVNDNQTVLFFLSLRNTFCVWIQNGLEPCTTADQCTACLQNRLTGMLFQSCPSLQEARRDHCCCDRAARSNFYYYFLLLL